MQISVYIENVSISRKGREQLASLQSFLSYPKELCCHAVTLYYAVN